MPSDDLKISDGIEIPTAEIDVTSIRAQGAGGQNVNKVSSAIHLRFDLANSESIPVDLKTRLLAVTDRRLTADGVVVIKAQSFRTRERNLRDATERLVAFISSALQVQKPRKPSRPSKAAKRKRLDQKRQRSQLKKTRRLVDPD